MVVLNCDISLKSFGLGPKAQLLVDGNDVSRFVKALSLSIDPEHHGHLMTVQVIPQPMDVELRDVDVRIDGDMHEFLVRLGWTPPPEEATDAIH